MAIYFISDLHLQETAPDSMELFLDFLRKHRQNIEAIYILGDFFDSWVGDDYNTPFIQSIKAILISLHASNTTVFFMRGNRDFLIGEKFFTDTHCIAIPDPYVLPLGDIKILLTHGDLLTTADTEYRNFRAFVQTPITKFIFLHLPKKLRLAIARYLRSNSVNVCRRRLQKNPNVFAVTQEVIVSWVAKYRVNAIIHGHIHLPGVHEFTIGSNSYKRFVLGNWDKRAKILLYENGEFKLQEIY